MTEFAETELRHYCRNPRCRMKLPAPVDNPRKVFCTRGCHSSFYLKRCLVCEKDKPTGRANRLFCRRPKCRNEYSRNRQLFAFVGQGSQSSPIASAEPIKSGVKTVHSGVDRWRQGAGPKLTENQFHCATVPDGPDCQWRDGAYERIEAKNRAALKAHFAKLAKDCLIQPHHPPINIQRPRSSSAVT